MFVLEEKEEPVAAAHECSQKRLIQKSKDTITILNFFVDQARPERVLAVRCIPRDSNEQNYKVSL